MATTGQISSCGFRHPVENLPAYRTGADREAVFADAFGATYCRDAARIHRGSPKTNLLVTREVPVEGLGIADLLAVAWQKSCGLSARDFAAGTVGSLDPTVRAFEVKLERWRKGMMQAYRYGYFADASILVLPMQKILLASRYLSTFRTLQVGLWGFDPESLWIRAVYTPRPVRPRVTAHRKNAILRALESVTARRAE